ncbi:hypothetical protein ADK35_16970, partial [Streptomyces viridochromogenes]|uniref:phosphopantetheine-binding protein n=1 Tax=Streptomyces viridochromogenes TaxID=1938 RepID=UPI0006C04E6C
MTQHPPTADELLRSVTDTFGSEEPPSDDDSLITWGLDSITLMKIAGGWRRRGIPISFAELAKEPTLRAWRELLQAHVPATARPAERTPAAMSRRACEEECRRSSSRAAAVRASSVRRSW